MTNEQVLTGGLTPTQWVKLLEGDKAKNSHKALEYLDGCQEKQIEQLLSSPGKGRKQWRELGIIPRWKNVTKNIVEKSGMLFKDKPPKFEIYAQGSEAVDEASSDRLMEELAKTEWVETFSNLDQVVRLLKTALLLIQYNVEEDQLTFDILTRANANVIVNPATRGIDSIIYRTSDYEGVETFRIITKDQYIDLVRAKSVTTVTNIEDNPYGLVPVVAFHDTQVPRVGFWNEPGMDLIAMNEMVNLHLTDSEYAITYAKRPTLYAVNADFGTDSSEQFETFGTADRPLPSMVPADGSEILAGPGQIVSVSSASGAATTSLQYLTAEVNIKPLDEVVFGWIQSCAADWSVRIESPGTGRATSGFQIIVEEMDNMDLRKRRQRMFEGGFKRFYKAVAAVINTIREGSLPTDSELFADFADPYLPVDDEQNEKVWSLRIAEGRASRVDYFMTMNGMTKAEAEEKIREIDAYKNQTEPPTPKAEVNPEVEPEVKDEEVTEVAVDV